MARVFPHEPPKPGSNKKAAGPKEVKKPSKGKTTDDNAADAPGLSQDGRDGGRE